VPSTLQGPKKGRMSSSKGPRMKLGYDICIEFSLEISEEKKKEGENPSRGASVTHPRRFHDRFRGRSSPFFVILQSSTG